MLDQISWDKCTYEVLLPFQLSKQCKERLDIVTITRQYDNVYQICKILKGKIRKDTFSKPRKSVGHPNFLAACLPCARGFQVFRDLDVRDFFLRFRPYPVQMCKHHSFNPKPHCY